MSQEPKPHEPKPNEPQAHPNLFPFINLLARTLVRLFAPRFRVTGRHNIPHSGAVIFTPNHTSDADPTLMHAAMRRRCWYMAKRQIWEEYPIIGKIIEYIQAFPVDQNGVDRAALQWSLHVLEQGEPLVIFPEGHCSKDGQMQPLEPGVTMIAVRAGVPVVPVGIAHAPQVQPYATITPRFTLAPVRIHFGSPIDLSNLVELPRREQRKVATERIEVGMRRAAKVARGEK